MKVTVAAVQMASSDREDENLEKADALVREAAKQGAGIVLLPEFFSTPFFGNRDWDPEYFAFASSAEASSVLRHMSALAAEFEIVLPVSFFERGAQRLLQRRRDHRPDGRYPRSLPQVSHARWSPSVLREVLHDAGQYRVPNLGHGVRPDRGRNLLGPVVSGGRAVHGARGRRGPVFSDGDRPHCHDHWQVVQQGHAGANFTPLVAANRIGRESGPHGITTFWGRSFIADETGAVVAKASTDREEIIVATFDLAEIRRRRAEWDVFRDRRPELYGSLLTLDGEASGRARSGFLREGE